MPDLDDKAGRTVVAVPLGHYSGWPEPELRTQQRARLAGSCTYPMLVQGIPRTAAIHAAQLDRRPLVLAQPDHPTAKLLAVAAAELYRMITR
ncbi:hypothetical protein [Amycolatopsis rubida]|uniref:Uncharacterized protein n=1 Tax=Amycolatopsis rubida TaxID=112413 RepID=A0A1I5XDY5_9PSEU|nr:hypothetical protein [Amycolatopsis rubida]SFQ30178.1 hypothetical protein SAMN05421854_110176 [Amycolatopsis rubida]